MEPLAALKDYINFSLDTLLHRKLRSWLTMIGIFIGIAALVALISLGEGLRGAILGQFGFLGPDVLSIQASGVAFAGPPGQGVTTPLNDDLVDELEAIPGVEAAINRYIEPGQAEFNDKTDVVFAWNVPEGRKRAIFEKMVNLKAEQGRLLKDGDGFNAVLGHNFVEEDNAYGKAVQVGNTIAFQGKDFKVVGILEKKGSFIFDTAIVMNEDILKDNFRDDDTVNVIGIKVRDVSLVNDVKQRVEQVMRQERDVKKGEEDFIVQSPEAALESLEQILFAVQLFVSVIAFISIIVGGIGISNTMYTAVLERTKEIGIMKSVGARNSAIFMLFFIESGFLGLVGGMIGVLLGILLAFGGAYAGQAALGTDLIQADVKWWLVAGALFFSCVVGLVAGLLPAVRASRKNPVDSLRYAK
jgi:putative ABC transport system permease protein